MKAKKWLLVAAVMIVAVVGMVMLVACGGGEGTITVVSREDGSGTRDGFDTLVGIKGELRADATILTSTGAIMQKVASSPNAIGYISLGSLNDTVKALTVDGIEANAENVINKSYKLQRNFNVVTKKGVELSEAMKDFEKFILSDEGQKIVSDNGYVPLTETEEYTTQKNTVSGSLKISGSSSVNPLMVKLVAAYEDKQKDVEIEVNSSDSGTGINDVTNAAQDAPNTMGMVSRDLKDGENQVEATKIAIDGIAVIVNNSNALSDISVDNLAKIYKGEINKFEEIK